MRITGTTQAPAELDCTFAMICPDNSMMNARLFKGDTVFIHKQSEVDNGAIAVIMTEKGLVLRRVYLHDEYMELRPENLTIPTLSYHQSEVEIIGKAVGFMSTAI